MSTKLLILAGPTAVGKTALAINWALQFNGEIIGADSRQIYQYMDIGTSKPTPAEQRAAPHHLIDFVEPNRSYTLANYQSDAYAVIDDLHARGKLPILCGGTGQYITATLEGWQIPAVPPDPELRAKLEEQSKSELFAQLQVLDPVTAKRIDADNPRRLVRAVEVCILTGQPFSELRRKNPPDYDVLPFVLTLEPRELLYERADVRIDQMLQAGWLAEVENLYAMGYSAKLPSMSALGYPQIGAVLRGEMTLDEACALITRYTRRFIRRQYTWLRGHDPGWRWISHEDAASEAISRWLD